MRTDACSKTKFEYRTLHTTNPKKKYTTVNPYQIYKHNGWHNIKVDLIHWVLVTDLYSRFTMKGPASITPSPFFTAAKRNTNKGFSNVTCYCSIICQRCACGLAPLHKESLFGMTRVPQAWEWGAKQEGNKSSLAAYTTIFVKDEFKCHDFLK